MTMQCKFLAIGFLVLTLRYFVISEDEDDYDNNAIRLDPDDVALDTDTMYNMTNNVSDSVDDEGHDPRKVPTFKPNIERIIQNCSKEIAAAEAKEKAEARFKDSLVFDLTFGEPCGPEKRCDHRLGLVCFSEFLDGFATEPAICDCDSSDPIYTRWSESGGKCAKEANSTCVENSDCASYSCNNITIASFCDPVVERPTPPPSKASVLSTSFITKTFLVWLVIISAFEIMEMKNYGDEKLL